MVIRSALKYGVEQLKGVRTAVLDTQLLLCEVLKISKLQLIISSDRELTKKEWLKFEELIKRRAKGEPTQYIIGKCEFMGLDFKVTPDVLIPRPDTETLVELVINKMPQGGRILEIGTGSGCIAISLAYYLKDCTIDAIDISQPALEVAKENAVRQGVDSRIRFLNRNIFYTIEGVYDAIVSNPPYIKKEVIPTLQIEVQKEPVIALVGGEDGLIFYRRIIEIAPYHMTEGALLAVEVGYNQGDIVKNLIKKSGYFSNIAAQKDLAGIDRVIHCRLCAKA